MCEDSTVSISVMPDAPTLLVAGFVAVADSVLAGLRALFGFSSTATAGAAGAGVISLAAIMGGARVLRSGAPDASSNVVVLGAIVPSLLSGCPVASNRTGGTRDAVG